MEERGEDALSFEKAGPEMAQRLKLASPRFLLWHGSISVRVNFSGGWRGEIGGLVGIERILGVVVDKGRDFLIVSWMYSHRWRCVR